jgi:hypothetical protein
MSEVCTKVPQIRLNSIFISHSSISYLLTVWKNSQVYLQQKHVMRMSPQISPVLQRLHSEVLATSHNKPYNAAKVFSVANTDIKGDSHYVV